jgi:hypothetical protein
VGRSLSGVRTIPLRHISDWKPVFFLLESRGFDSELYNAGQSRRPKTDLLTELHRPGFCREPVFPAC